MPPTCDRCREPLDYTARVCPKCGDPVIVERPSLKVRLELAPTPPRPAWVLPAMLFGLAVAAGLAAVLLL